MDCIVHGVAKNRTRLSDFHFHLCLLHWQERSSPLAPPGSPGEKDRQTVSEQTIT